MSKPKVHVTNVQITISFSDGTEVTNNRPMVERIFPLTYVEMFNQVTIIKYKVGQTLDITLQRTLSELAQTHGRPL